jgi:predicted enzyme related to lactoylglutathione lyase
MADRMPPRLRWPSWIGVVVDDLEAQAAFYESLGLQRMDTGPDWIEFEVEGRTFELLGRSAVPQYDARRYQVGFDVEDIEASRASLAAAGAEQISEVETATDGSSRWCYFRDPEGNVFEITQRRAGEEDLDRRHA